MERIASGVYQISRGVNAFVVDGDEGVTLVDTGMPGRHGAVVEGLSDIGRSAKDITAILVTHGHFDHFGGAASLWSASDADVYASHQDASILRGDTPPPPPPILERVPFIGAILGLLPAASPVPVSHIVAEGYDETMPEDFTVIDTPGHTEGHLSYLLDRDGGIVFVGDAATQSNGKIKRGFFNRSTPDIVGSIAKLGSRDFEIACFGHSAPLTSGASKAFAGF